MCWFPFYLHRGPPTRARLPPPAPPTLPLPQGPRNSACRAWGAVQVQPLLGPSSLADPIVLPLGFSLHSPFPLSSWTHLQPSWGC